MCGAHKQDRNIRWNANVSGVQNDCARRINEKTHQNEFDFDFNRTIRYARMAQKNRFVIGAHYRRARFNTDAELRLNAAVRNRLSWCKMGGGGRAYVRKYVYKVYFAVFFFFLVFIALYASYVW